MDRAKIVAFEKALEHVAAFSGPWLQLGIVQFRHLRLFAESMYPVDVEQGHIDARRRDDHGFHAHQPEERLHLHNAEMADAFDFPGLGGKGDALRRHARIGTQVFLRERKVLLECVKREFAEPRFFHARTCLAGSLLTSKTLRPKRAL